MDVLQQALAQAMASLPELFLEKLIAKKLQDQSITAPKSLARKIAKHIRSGNAEPFRYKGTTQAEKVTVAFTEADADELEHALAAFCEKQLPSVFVDVAGRINGCAEMTKSTKRSLENRARITLKT